MGSCVRVITAEDFEQVVASMDYAVVKQSKTASDRVNVFASIDGKSISEDVPEAMTVEEYRRIKQGRKNAIVYDCGSEGVELVIKYPNGFGVHAISTQSIVGGRQSIEVAVKCGRHIAYFTPVTDDLIVNVSLDELQVIMSHVENLNKTGYEYAKDFIPDKKYDRRPFLREVFRWMVGKIAK